MTEAASARFRGPRILAAALLANAVSIGCTLAIFGVFLGPVAEELGAPKAQLALGSSLWQLAMGLGSPTVGWLIARYSLRLFMLLGVSLLGIGLALMSRVEPLWLAGLLYFLAGVGSLLCGPLPSATLVANWYIERRGRALGIAMSGTTVGVAVMPLLAAFLIESLGWRDALAWIGLGAIALLVPVIAFWVVLRPEDVGQGPDGRDPVAHAAAVPLEFSPLGTAEILRDRRFQVLACIYGCLFGAGSALIVFIVSFATHLGMSLQSGALFLSARAITTIVGRNLGGSFADRVDNRLLLGIAIGGYGALWLALSFATSAWMFTVVGMAMGFFGGALVPLQGSIIGKIFGRRAFSQVLGLNSGAQLPFSLAVAPLFGLVLDRTGDDYGFAFRAFFVLYVVAFLLVFALRIPERGPDDAVRPVEPANV